MPKETTDNDKLIASSLAEAEAHRIYFRDLVMTNEGMQQDLKQRLADLAEKEKLASATEERQLGTQRSQDQKATELASREAKVKEGEDKLAADIGAHDAANADVATKQNEAQAAIDNRERDISAQEVAHRNAVSAFESAQAKAALETADREAKLTALKQQLDANTAALNERERTYKEKAEKEILERLTKNIAR
jgi:hypothetical protein